MEHNAKLKILRNIEIAHTILKGLCILKKIENETDKKKKRSCCVRAINRDRKTNGFFAVTFQKIRELDPGQFFIYTRMTPEIYNVLLNLLTPMLVKSSIREPINPECRLAVLLLYLSQGTSLQSLAGSFKLGKETVRQIVLETSEILWKILYPVCLAEPSFEDYKQISNDFWTIWNMPNCVGSIAGKHIAIRCPPNSGNQYFCYKKHFSIVVMGVCDAKYKFTNIDIGAYGSQNDGGIFHISRFGKRLLGNMLPIPGPKNLPNSTLQIPHYFVADAAFPLTTNVMPPYSGTPLPLQKENFNKRLSTAQRTIENSFGILVSRWRILLTTLHMLPENAEKIILACVALHNFLMVNKQISTSYCPRNYVDWEYSDGQLHHGLWRSEVDNNIPSILPSPNTHRYGGQTSTIIRNNLCNFLYENETNNFLINS